MRVEDEYMFTLLDEIADACKNNNARYYLITTELLYFYAGKRVPSCTADICMTLNSFDMIREELSSNSERIVESIETNDNMPGVYYRYVATDTFMIQPEYHKVLKENGIAVNIHIIRNKSSLSKKLCSIENIMENGIEGIDHKESLSLERTISIKKKNGDFSGWINKMLKETSLTDVSLESLLKIPELGIICLSKGFWEKEKLITIDKKKYSTVYEPDCFLVQCYGEDYNKINYRSRIENFRIIADADISYKDLPDDYLAQFSFDIDFWERRKKFLNNFYYEWSELNREVRQKENNMFLQRSRLLLWKRYYFDKNKIIRLFKEERFDELKMMFFDFEKHIKQHIPYRQIPVFDKEIWNIYIETLLAQGNIEEVELYKTILKDYPTDELSTAILKEYYNSENIPKETMRLRNIFNQ